MAEPELTLPLIEEELVIGKRSSVTGRVRVSTRTEEVEVLAGLDLGSVTVEVTRVPIDRDIDAAPPVRTEGDVTIVPVVEEVMVVEKRLVLKEEIHIRRQATQEHVELPVTLRKQRAEIERLDDEKS